MAEEIHRAAALLVADTPASRLPPAGDTPWNTIRRPRHATHARLALQILRAFSLVIQIRHAYPYANRTNTPGSTDVVAKPGTAISIRGTRCSDLETTKTLLRSVARPGGRRINGGLACKALLSATLPRLTGITPTLAWLTPSTRAHCGTTIETRPACTSIRPAANPLRQFSGAPQSNLALQLMLGIVLLQGTNDACFANIRQRRIARLTNLTNRKRKRTDHIDILLCNGKRGKKGNCKRCKNPIYHVRMVPTGCSEAQ